MLQEAVIPDYEKYLKAIDLTSTTTTSSANPPRMRARHLRSSAVRLIGLALGLASLLAFLLAWQVIRSTNRALRDLTANLDQGALQTASAARQVSAASQNLSSGASEQAASVEETSASLEEMSSMIRSTADNAEKAKALAGEAHSVAQPVPAPWSK